jgi:UDP-GlcNAc:undecaprenyl-phosphate GlcNAc-1-phosphate transferase
VWYVFMIIGMLSCLLAVAMVNLVKLEMDVPIVFFLAHFVFVFIILYRNTIKYKAPKK